MQAERVKTREAIGHVRMRIRRDLGWTTGFPADNAWHVVALSAPAQERRLEGRDLQAATACVRRLTEEHRAALRKLVGDEDTWAQRQLELIDALKPLVGQGLHLSRKPLLEPARWPSAIANRLKALLETDIGDLAAACAWSQWTQPKPLGKLLGWLEDHHEALRTWRGLGAPLQQIVRFVHLAAGERPARITPLLGWLTHPQAHGRGCERPRNTIKDAKMAAELGELLEAIATFDEPTRHRALDAFNLIAAPSHLERWDIWWSRYERARVKVDQLVKVPDVEQKLGRARKRLQTVTKAMPRPVQGTTLKQLVLKLAAPERTELFATLRTVMRDWPESKSDGDIRYALAAYWTNLDGRPRRRATLRQLMRGFGRYYELRGNQALTPWLSIIRAEVPLDRPGGIDYDLLDHKLGKTGIETFFDVLEKQREPLDEEGAYHLVNLVLTLPRGRVADALQALGGSTMWSEHISFNGMVAAAALTDKAPERYVPALKLLQRDDHARVKQLAGVVAKAIGDTLTLDLLEAGHLETLLAIAGRLSLVTTLGVDAPKPPKGTSNPPWLTDYPEELAPALAYLAGIDGDAEATAEKVLGKNKLQRELQGLRVIDTPTPAQAARLAKLEGWKPKPLSKASIDRAARSCVRRGCVASSRCGTRRSIRPPSPPSRSSSARRRRKPGSTTGISRPSSSSSQSSSSRRARSQRGSCANASSPSRGTCAPLRATSVSSRSSRARASMSAPGSIRSRRGACWVSPTSQCSWASKPIRSRSSAWGRTSAPASRLVA